jgi:hypothetical protein
MFERIVLRLLYVYYTCKSRIYDVNREDIKLYPVVDSFLAAITPPRGIPKSIAAFNDPVSKLAAVTLFLNQRFLMPDLVSRFFNISHLTA